MTPKAEVFVVVLNYVSDVPHEADDIATMISPHLWSGEIVTVTKVEHP